MESAPERGRTGRALFALATVAVVASSAFVAQRLLFSTFRPWDDEGYMLLVVREFVKNGGLYDRIQTPYAPLFFEVTGGLSRLFGFALDNESARWIALVIWIGASLGCLVLVYRATRSAVFAILAYALAFPLLMALNGEPMHPSQGIVLLLPWVALFALDADEGARRPIRNAIAGSLAGAILCTKLNVGTFVLLAFAAGFLHRAGGRPRARLLGRIALVAIAVFPLFLMRPLFSKPWALELALLDAVSLGALASIPWFSFRDRGESGARGGDALAFCAGACVTGLVALGIAFATGTTLRGLWQGLVFETVRVPSVFWAEPDLPSRAVLLVPLALVPLVAALHRDGRPRGPRSALAIAVLKCAAAVAVIVVDRSAHRCLAALPCLWILAVPASVDEGRPARNRWTLSLLAVAVSLQIYPVAGSQVNFSAFLFPVVALVGLHDAGREIGRWLGIRRVLVPVGAAVLLAFHPFYDLLPGWLAAYPRFVPLGLPGAKGIRLPESAVAIQRWLAANLRANGSTFFGVPGLHSLHLWTGEPPPVPFYSHMWMVQTLPEQQREIAAVIDSRQDLCVVRNRSLVELWLQGRPMPDSPIVAAIERGFEPAGRTGGYELLVRKGRTPDLVLSARRAAIPAAIARTPEDRLALRLSFPAIPGARVARIAVCDPDRDRILFDTASDRGETALATVDPVGGELALPLALDARIDVLLLCPPEIARQDPDRILVRAYGTPGMTGEAGAVVARLPLVR